MNAESLAITIDEGRTCFWSRSRQELWRKGETSGNVQHVVSITADCDADALVVEVVKDGPACHTGAESCFFQPVYLSEELKQFSYEGLYRLIQGRKTEPKEGSYTTYLFDKGPGQDPQKGGRGVHGGHHRRPQGGQGGDRLRDRGPDLSCDGPHGPDGHHRGGYHPGSWRSATSSTTRSSRSGCNEPDAHALLCPHPLCPL